LPEAAKAPLSALDPGKQGLKLELISNNGKSINFLSALDPGKQGLKLLKHPGRLAASQAFSA